MKETREFVSWKTRELLKEAVNAVQYVGESAQEAALVVTYASTSKPARRLVFGLFGSVLTVENGLLAGLNIAQEDWEKALVSALLSGGFAVGSLVLNKGSKSLNRRTESILETRGNFSPERELLMGVHRVRPPFWQ